MSLENDGYIIIKNIFKKDKIESYRNILNNYFSTQKYFSIPKDTVGKILPGFAGKTPLLNELNNLHKSNEIIDPVSKIFQEKKFIFLDHSDLHQNVMTNWHRDVYDYSKGGGKNIWHKDCFIIKVCLLLQDHKDNKLGLSFQPGTHKSNIKSKAIHAITESTDLIIFNQRILHKGQAGKESYRYMFKKDRYLITYGFGLDNYQSKFHIKGASIRQNLQRKTAGIK